MRLDLLRDIGISMLVVGAMLIALTFAGCGCAEPVDLPDLVPGGQPPRCEQLGREITGIQCGPRCFEPHLPAAVAALPCTTYHPDGGALVFVTDCTTCPAWTL